MKVFRPFGPYIRVGFFALFSAMLCGCGDERLASGLSEKDSAEILVVLHRAGIDASREATTGSRQSSNFSVHVAEKDLVPALEVLREFDLPRGVDENLEKLLAPSGFVPPTADMTQLRMEYALGLQVEHLLNGLPGIVKARVLVRRANQGESQPARASVVLRFQGSFSATDLEKIQEVVAQAVPGLQSENVRITAARANVARAITGRDAETKDGAELVSVRPEFVFGFQVPKASRDAIERKLWVGLTWGALMVCGFAFLFGYFTPRRKRPRQPSRDMSMRGSGSFFSEKSADKISEKVNEKIV